MPFDWTIFVEAGKRVWGGDPARNWRASTLTCSLARVAYVKGLWR